MKDQTSFFDHPNQYTQYHKDHRYIIASTHLSSNGNEPLPSQPQKKSKMRVNYVFIDYENVQPENIEVLNHDFFNVLVFVGANQTKIPFDIVESIQRMGERARYIKVLNNGPNSLDFHIAFYIGQLSLQHPEAYFHIISKDTGFDPLMLYLKSIHIQANRWESIMSIPFVQVNNAKSLTEKLEIVRIHFQCRTTSFPKTVQTLSNTIKALLQKRVTDEEVNLLIKMLQKQGLLQIDDTQVSYTFTSQPKANDKQLSTNQVSASIDNIQDQNQPSSTTNTPKKSTNGNLPPDKILVILSNLQRSGKAKPASLPTLFNHINALFKKELADEEIALLVKTLQKQGIVQIDGTKISYTLP